MAKGEKPKFDFTEGSILDHDGETLDTHGDSDASTRAMQLPDDYGEYGDEATRTLQALEDDDDGEEKTVIMDVPDDFGAPEATLLVVAGPDIGTQFPLRKDEIGVGRAYGNDVLINDPSVSRNHFEIYREASGWRVRDRGSGNGTLVDGQSVDELFTTASVVIEAGKTVMQLIIDHQPPAYVPPLPEGAGGAAPVPERRGGSNTPADLDVPPQIEEIGEYDEPTGGTRWGLMGIGLLVLLGGVWAAGELWMGWFDFFGMSPQARQAAEATKLAEEAVQGATAEIEKAQKDAEAALAAATAAANAAAGSKAPGTAGAVVGEQPGTPPATTNTGAKPPPGGAGEDAPPTEAATANAVASGNLNAGDGACDAWASTLCAGQGADVCATARHALADVSSAACAARMAVYRDAHKTDARGNAIAPGEVVSLHARDEFEKGRQHLKASAWGEALTAFKSVAALDLDTFPKDELKTAIDRSQLEVDAMQKLELASKKEQAGQFAEAYEIYMSIPAESSMHTQARDAAPGVQGKFVDNVEKRVTEIVKKGPDAIAEAEGVLAEAKKLFPQDTQLAELERTLGGTFGDTYQALTGEDVPSEWAEGDENGGQVAAGAAVPAAGTPSNSAANTAPAVDFKPMFDAYNRGALDDAKRVLRQLDEQQVSKADRSRIKRYRNAVDSFQKYYGPGKSAAASKSAAAASLLEKAHSADRTLGGTHRQEIAGMLADIYYRKATSAYSESKYESAAKLATKALNYKGNHENARAIFDKTQVKGVEFYEQALAQKEAGRSALARPLLHKVLGIMPSSSPTAKKAKKLLSEL